MLAGMQEVAAELGGAEAMQVHQDVDAYRLEGDMLGQQFEQQTVEAGAEQADVQGVYQVPEIRRLAQRDEQEQVVAEHGEQHAVEGTVDAHQVFLGGGAGMVGAEEHRQEDGAGGVDANQQSVGARRQIDWKPEVAHLHRALGKGVVVTTFLQLPLAIGGGEKHLHVVE